MKYPRRDFRVCTILSFAFAVLTASLYAQSPKSPNPWGSIGPYGGDARAFAASAANPQHVYLGDTNSWVFESTDAGAHWQRLGRVDGSDDLIVDSLLVDAADSRTVFAGVWRVDRPDGGLFVSHDGGTSWTAVPQLKGQSVRSVAQAPSDPRQIVVGTLEGVFRSLDSGRDWERISPVPEDPLSREIHEVESLAIDPRNPDVIYAGTWHLPWKTKDGGRTWRNIKQGVIDDSDVFSILVDPERPTVVYASACSGIYKSENGGELFKKVQGIPSTARRTRVLMQDVHNHDVVYAGTTEGLYRTRDAGRTWQAMTGPDVIVNDIYLDPDQTGRVLLATDRGGVLASDDGGVTFLSSNPGFSARKVEALVVDGVDSVTGGRRILAGVVNDKQYGGVFETADEGRSWQQISDGLGGRDVFTLAQAKDGTVLAGTGHGIFKLERTEGTPRWTIRSSIVNYGTKIVKETVQGHTVNRLEKITIPARQMSSRVADFDLSTDTWLVACQEGLFTSHDQGATWQGGLVLGSGEYHSVAAWDGKMLAARRQGVVYSKDKGETWDPMRLPSKVKDIRAIAFSPDGALWVGAGDGVYLSRDEGLSWYWLEKVPLRDVGALAWDATAERMLVTSRSSAVLYSIEPKSLAFAGTTTGFKLFLPRAAQGVRYAASLQDGVLVEPAKGVGLAE